MGESITEGTVIAWYKKAGDTISLDETLLEIGTDKVDTEVPSPTAGTVGQILVEEGETVDVGTVLATVETAAAGARSKVETPKPTSAPTVANVANDVPVVMPKMGESITEGTVIAWHKKVGDLVALDEPLLEIGTDKVDTEVPSPAAGVLKAVLVDTDVTVDVGTLVAIIGSTVGPQPAETVVRPKEKAPPRASATQAAAERADGAPQDRRHLSDGSFLSPLVRSIAKTEGVSRSELEALSGSGREGRLTKTDVLGYLESRKAPKPAPPARPQPAVRPKPSRHPKPSAPAAARSRIEIVEMDRMRQLIAAHMIESKRTSAHVTSFAEADVTNLVRLRKANRAAFEDQHGIRLTYTPFFVYAAVEALRTHSLLNSSVEGNRILISKDYHVGIAVALEKTGLIVPVIKHAGRYSIAGLAHAAHDLAHRARANDLQPDDLQGGTFTLTNVGSLGSVMGTPIILQPQVAILATGSIKKKPVVIEDPDHGDVIAIRHMMYLSLSYDHRIIDGAMGISFLRRFTDVVEGFDSAMEV